MQRAQQGQQEQQGQGERERERPRRSGYHEDVMPDTGCEIAPKCLECPLPACRYDLAPKQALYLKELLDYARYRAQGLSVEKAAFLCGRSRRAGFRMEHVLRDAIQLMRSRSHGSHGSVATHVQATSPRREAHLAPMVPDK